MGEGNSGILGRESKKKDFNHLYFIRLSILPVVHYSRIPLFRVSGL